MKFLLSPTIHRARPGFYLRIRITGFIAMSHKHDREKNRERSFLREISLLDSASFPS
jgi:hypothetical protein